jgi:hypothetical protein
MDKIDIYELDFNRGNESGYEAWQKSNRKRRETILKEWSIPLFEKVTVSLTFVEGEHVGYLDLTEYPSVVNRKKYAPLKLRLNLSGQEFELGESPHIEFTSDDIKQIVRLNPAIP